MAAARVTTTEKRFLIIFEGGARQRITVPAGSKITYGKLTPHDPGDRFSGDGRGSYAIRIYEGGEGIQLGVFPKVASFRDLDALKVERLTTDKEGNAMWKTLDDDGLLDATADALGKVPADGEGGW